MTPAYSSTLFLSSPSLLADLLDGSPNGVVAYEAIREWQDGPANGQILDYRTVYFNPQLLAITGYTDAELTNQLLFQRAPYVRTRFEQLRLVVDEKQPHDYQYFNERSGRWVAVQNRPLGNGFFATFRDVDDMVRTDQQLKRQHTLFEGVLQTSESSIMVYEAVKDETGELQDFRVVLANEASARAGNRDRHAVIGRLLTDLNPDTKQSGLWEQYLSVYRTDETFRGNHHYPNIDKWFDVTINKLGDGLVATFSDITLAQKAARQIEEQARLFDGVLNTITNGLSVLEAVRDENGCLTDVRYVRISRAIVIDTGRSEAELVGNLMGDLFPGTRQTAYWPAFVAAFETGDLQRFEVHYHYDGIDNYTDNWVTRLDADHIISIYSIINERKEVENQIRHQAELLQSVLNSCQIPIALFEAIRDETNRIIDFRYLLQNEANAQTVGFPMADVYTQTMLEVLPNLKSSGIFDRYVATVDTGLPQRFEQHLADATLNAWFDFSVVKYGDGIVVSASDQTLLRQTLQRTEELVNDLQQSNANLEQFAYVASHDLQEPLRKIQSFGDMLLATYQENLPDEARDMLRRMQSAAGRMSLLIQDLLAFSRLSTGHELRQPVDLQQLIADILIDLELVISEKHAQIEVGPLPVLTGNPLQLQQLFQNLVSNALKFSQPGVSPQLTISAQSIAPADLPTSVLNRQNRSWIAIAVTDNGIGFDEKHKERIFQLFERLHGRSDQRVGGPAGTGIGLAICRKVAENHGGTVIAQSQPGQGATFTVYLPL